MQNVPLMSAAAQVPVVSFAVQQFLQTFDFLVTRITQFFSADETTPSFKDTKKSVASVFSFVLGLVTVQVLDLHLLPQGGLFNTLVSALAVGAGTEGANSVTKLLSYLKDQAGNKA